MTRPPAIDRPARREAAELLRRFASGRLANAEFDRRALALARGTQDRAIRAIVDAAYWTFAYGDRPLPQIDWETRRELARWALFLYSDRPYRWPELPGPEGGFLPSLGAPLAAMACIVGFLPLLIVHWALYGAALAAAAVPIAYAATLPFRRFDAAGDAAAWPFLSPSDLDDERTRPPLLAGAKRRC